MTTAPKSRGGKDAEFEALLKQVKASRGFDVTCYKRATLQRRIAKRMSAVNARSYAEYRDCLQAAPREYTELFNTLLINVTSFFRDEEAWQALAKDVIPRVLGEAAEGEVRVWTAGCASGEEAYTLAMLLAEAMGEEAFKKRAKIYATDMDEEALAHARRAAYSAEAVEAVPERLREKYFERAGREQAFRKDLRRSIIFGKHDLLADAPISRLDLLTCRNTLMYFNADAQSRIVARLHFALKPNGFIFLGKAEMLQNHVRLFDAVNLKHRIFMKAPGSIARDIMPPADPRAEAAEKPRAQDVIRAAAFEGAPVAQVIVDEAGSLAAANREARALFDLAPRDVGRAFQDLDMSYRPIEMRTLVDRVRRAGQTVSPPVVSWPSAAGEERSFRLQAAPLADGEGRGLGVSILFFDMTSVKALEDEHTRSRQELETVSEELQSANEELETTNEELQSTIEELETTNEELQSGNEEMETMNEELQSTNQELHAINDELSTSTDALNDANAFLESILSGVESGVAVVNADLAVEQWNRRCEDLWGLRSEEVLGKNLLGLDVGLPVDQLKAPIKSVLSKKSERRDLTVDAVNRRGKKTRCRVTCTPRLGAKKEIRGVILLMEPWDGPEEKGK